MKRFFLLGISDFFIVVFYSAVGSCLFIVLLFKCFVKQFVIDFFDVFIAVVDIEMCSAAVNIFSFELAAVMIYRAFTDHCAYRSFHKISHPFLIRRSRGSVTLAKSNAKALLTGEPIKNATCKQVLRSPRGRSGFLKKATCTLQKL